MGTPLLDMAATALCPHGGRVALMTGNARVRVGGSFAVVLSDQGMVAGCAFNVAGVAQPCLTTRFLTPASRVRIGGTPALLMTASGLCQGPTQAPQGPPMIVQTQVRVRGT